MKLVLLCLLLASCGFEYSDGNRVGTIYKISKKGFFCKSWEGTLKTGFLSNNSNGKMMSEEFKFSVEEGSEDVAIQLEQAMKLNKQVQVEYVQKIFNRPCAYDSQYRVKKVNIIE